MGPDLTSHLNRYMVAPKKRPAVAIQPPFLRPELSDRQLTIKVSDNGIHGSILRTKVRPHTRTVYQSLPALLFIHCGLPL